MSSVEMFVGPEPAGRQIKSRVGVLHATVPSMQKTVGSAAADSFSGDVDEAFEKLSGAALRRGANAVCNVRVETTERGSGFMFITAYGDGVVLK